MRLDSFLVAGGYFSTRTKAKQAIERGEVTLNGVKITKPAFAVNEDHPCNIQINFEESFVSLGGYKLSKAIKDFDFSVNGLVCADIGASTGGFTDCLLQNGAKRVFAVDVNGDLLAPRLKADKRVAPVIKNCKDLTSADFDAVVEFLAADLSFISETATLPFFYDILKDGAFAVILIKPQFENEHKRRFKNGIIRDKKIILNACRRVFDCAVQCGFVPVDITSAPVSEDKNREFLFLIRKIEGTAPPFTEFSEKLFR